MIAGSIRLTGLGKRYPLHRGSAPRSLKEAVLGAGPRRGRRGWEWVLRDIDLEVAPGAAVGLVGPNGAGKSTLLRLIGGVGRPTVGQVEVGGQVGALFELGTGFHPDLSGREGAVTALIISGCTRRGALELLPAVAAFAELEDHLDQPLRTYSTGMAARLAFAVATASRPDILLVDETLSVGDLAFQRRCLERVAELRAAGTTVVLVSHDPPVLRRTCEEAVWLQGGRIQRRGPVDEVLDAYIDDNEEATRAATPASMVVERTSSGALLVPGENRVGSQEATIRSVRLLDLWGAPVSDVTVGSGLVVEIQTDVPEPAAPARAAARVVRRPDKTVCIDTSTLVEAHDGLARLEIERLDLAPGIYDVQVGLFDVAWDRTYDHHSAVYELRVSGEGAHGAVLAPPLVWSRGAARR